MNLKNRGLISCLTAVATFAAGLSAAQADTWKYAFEESLTEVQGFMQQSSRKRWRKIPIMKSSFFLMEHWVSQRI